MIAERIFTRPDDEINPYAVRWTDGTVTGYPTPKIRNEAVLAVEENHDWEKEPMPYRRK